ncbi:MAG: hypothetical protein FWG08_04850 [Propionibacteriaceae bacterium]|nr:hypothetical protein [Propionibacteriaceae bacterium]
MTSGSSSTKQGYAPGHSYTPGSDQELLDVARGGDRRALKELWERHSPYGFAVAQGLAPELGVESLNTRSWCRIFDDMGVGNIDARGGFRPYLYHIIRMTASVEKPVAPDRFVVPAYRSLHTREQEVLWYSHVESMRVSAMATLIGVSPRQVSKILTQARANLREAWVHRHLSILPGSSRCHQVWEDSLTTDQAGESTTKKPAHSCEHCEQARLDAVDVGSLLQTELLPVLAGISGSASLLDYLHNTGPSHRSQTEVPPALSRHLEGPIANRPRGHHHSDKPEDLWSTQTIAKRRRANQKTVDSTVDDEPLDADPPAKAAPGPHVESGDQEFSRKPSSRSVPEKTPHTRPPVASVVRAIGLILLGLVALIVVFLLATRSTDRPPEPQPSSPPTSATETPATGLSSVVITEVDTGEKNNLYPVVSGTAPANSEVTVTIADQTLTTTADETGQWNSPPMATMATTTRGVIEAKIGDGDSPAVAMFDISLPPSIVLETHDTYVWVMMTGLPSTTVEVLLDGEVLSQAHLDDVGNGSSQIAWDKKSHRVQVRYVDSERAGAASPEANIS